MKLFHYFLAVAGITLLIGGAFALRQKLQYDADGREITKLIAEYKAMGVPTNGDEFVKPIPEEQNAWDEIGPILMTKSGRGTGILYKSGIAMDLVHAGGRADLPLMHQYLQNNQGKRDAIVRALRRRPKIQVPHDFDEGFAMLLPEYAAMKGLCKDFCLEAYVAALEGDSKRMLDNLSYAHRFSEHCFDRSELIGGLVGLSIQRGMIDTGFRIMETSPSLAPQIEAYFKSPGFFGQKNVTRVLEGEFLAQVVLSRYYDTPFADKRKYPAPLDKVFKNPDSQQIEKASKPRKGDHMPESHALRAYLRRRLEAWKPFMTKLLARKENDPIPPLEEFSKVFEFTDQIPPSLDFLISIETDSEATYHTISLDLQHADVVRNILQALEIKRRTGKYPASLDQIGIPIRSLGGAEEFLYSADKDGVQVYSKRINTDNNRPAISMSFPPSLASEDPTRARRKKVLQDYRAGLIQYTGAALSSGSGSPTKGFVPPAGAPPLAPAGTSSPTRPVR